MSEKSVISQSGNAADAACKELFDAVIQRVRQAGGLDQAGPILEYCRPCSLENDDGLEVVRNAHEFDFVPCIVFGTNEGIYLDCFLSRSSGYGRYSICIGTMKTLHTDMDACKIMGELCGALMFHARQHLNEQCSLTADKCTGQATGAAPKRHRTAARRRQKGGQNKSSLVS